MQEQIKKPLFWAQKALQIFGRTTRLPDKVEDTIVPSIDAFGWAKLGDVELFNTSNPASNAVFTAAGFVPKNTNRLIVNVSTFHVDTGVTHNPQFVKRLNGTSVDVGLGSDRREIVPNEIASAVRPTWLKEGDLLGVKYAQAVVLGSVTIQILFIDFEEGCGEYVPFLP